jgi:hypothetical protein
MILFVLEMGNLVHDAIGALGQTRLLLIQPFLVTLGGRCVAKLIE